MVWSGPPPMGEQTVSDLRILIIEDDEIAAEILQQYIRHLRPNAKIDWCWNGYEALVLIGELKPELVFLDYMMPKLDGLEFLHSIKHLKSCENCKIAVVSAFVDRDKEREFFEQGADYVLPKPLVPEQIQDVLKHFPTAAERRRP